MYLSFKGITIKPLTELLGVKKANKTKMNMNERLHNRVSRKF